MECRIAVISWPSIFFHGEWIAILGDPLRVPIRGRDNRDFATGKFYAS